VNTGLRRVEADLVARQRREELFPPALFADPAWDLLLGLYRAHLLERPVTVADACALTAVPDAVALRWLLVLADRDLVLQSCHEGSKQVALTEGTVEAFKVYFSET